MGMTGLLIAAVFSAAMSTVSTSLNSSATLLMNDYYKRFINPSASERQKMLVLYFSTLVWGALGTSVAIILSGLPGNALDIWWDLSSIFSGGILGLFLLGMVSRVKNPAAITGVLIGAMVIAWLVFSPAWGKLDGLVAVRQGTVQVVSQDIHFGEQLQAGDQVEIAGNTYGVQSIADDGHHFTLEKPFDQDNIEKGSLYRINTWTRYRSPFHSFLIVVIGTLAILLTGLLAGKLSSRFNGYKSANP